MRAGELGGERDHHGLLARRVYLVKHLAKGIGVDLPRLGKLVLLNQQLVEALVREVDAVQVRDGSKRDGEREHREVFVLALQDVRGRVGDDARLHGISFFILVLIYARSARPRRPHGRGHAPPYRAMTLSCPRTDSNEA